MILELCNNLCIEKLLCHKQYNVVLTFHLVRCECLDGYVHINSALDCSPLCVERLNVSLVAVDKVNLTAVFCNVSTEYGTE